MQYLSLKASAADKMGQSSVGKIHYRVLTDEGCQQLYITMTANDNDGHFSQEIIPFGAIEQCVKGQGSVSSKQFASALQSRSANNPGFLAAILRAENLIAPDGRKHIVQPGWDAWKVSMFANEATLYEPPLPKEATNAKSKQSK